MNPKTIRWCALVVGLALASGCAEVRKATYPPDFVYLSRTDVTGAMGQLSANVWRIEDILATSETVLPYKREEIITILGDMKDTADGLGAGTVQTNHPLIDAHIDALRRDIDLALEDVKDDPPRYYRAGRLSGQCLACHRLRS